MRFTESDAGNVMTIEEPLGLTRSTHLEEYIASLDPEQRRELQCLLTDATIEELRAFVESSASPEAAGLVSNIVTMNDPIRDAILAAAKFLLSAHLSSTGVAFLQAAGDGPAVRLAQLPEDIPPSSFPGEYETHVAVLINFSADFSQRFANMSWEDWIRAKGTVIDALTEFLDEHYDEIFGDAMTVVPGPESQWRHIEPDEWPYAEA